jgi:hypothetical protein
MWVRRMCTLELKSSHELALGYLPPNRAVTGVNQVSKVGASPLSLQGKIWQPNCRSHASTARFLERPRQGYPPFRGLRRLALAEPIWTLENMKKRRSHSWGGTLVLSYNFATSGDPSKTGHRDLIEAVRMELPYRIFSCCGEFCTFNSVLKPHG